MTDLATQIAELREKVGRMTPGEWWLCYDDTGKRPVAVPSIQSPPELDCAIIHWDGFWQEYWQSARGLPEMDANAAGIVALRNTALPVIEAQAAEIEALKAERDRLREALGPFAEVAAWAERNGHDLVADFDMLLRGPGMQIAGHLQVQSPDFINARAALTGSAQP